ncbi:MAG: prolipoprotein diacylglyceryl transferase [Coxiellaceae bacterium]|nr:prolipoprotein diacylglyceryl transferase [Coxiellaceae bacterium]
MFHYTIIDPVAFKIGPLSVHWYGLMYLMGFIAAWGLGVRRASSSNGVWQSSEVSDLIFYAAVGVILGGRCGYVLFYNISFYWHHPAQIFAVWDGGMSFHGGFLGVAIALWLFSRHTEKNIWDVTDFAVPLVPIGLGFGRLGNFINNELWGRVTDVPWGVVFPGAGELPRHPSQLYECFTEGLLLFAIIWIFSSQPRPRFAVTGLFMLCYGCFRFILEFFRQPDSQKGFVALGWMTMGQLLSIPMVLIGAFALCKIYRSKVRDV